ncbi:MAG: (2Fe-2S) ferredoxin domain-containing protein [Burkholderiales bacterium]|nr:(2Fe-2S) ferredoxin domain-containing protein [Burkholderiales bacterium]
MFYKKHIFFCSNKRADNTGCGYIAIDNAHDFAKMYLQSLDMWSEGKIRVSKAGCLGRCVDGPTCVIYPEGVWYTYIDEADIKEIIDQYVINGEIVERLQI